MKIGDRVRSLRQARGITITELADILDMDQGNLSRLERGGQKQFSEQFLDKLANAFNMSLAEFFTFQGGDEASLQGVEKRDIYRIESIKFGPKEKVDLHRSMEVVASVRVLELSTDFARTLFGLRPSMSIKIINLKNDGMTGTIEPGDLMFVDVSINQFDTDGVYLFIFEGKIFVKRLQAVPGRLLVLSDNSYYREWAIEKNMEEGLSIIGKILITQSYAFNRLT